MISKHFFFFFKEKKMTRWTRFITWDILCLTFLWSPQKVSCSSIYVLFMSYQNLTWKCWDTTYVTSDCNFGNYCRLQYEASFFRKWRSQTYPKSWPKREKRKKKKQQKVKTKNPNKQTSLIANFQNPWKGMGVYLPWF